MPLRGANLTLEQLTYAMTEQTRTVARERLFDVAGTVDATTMREVDRWLQDYLAPPCPRVHLTRGDLEAAHSSALVSNALSPGADVPTMRRTAVASAGNSVSRLVTTCGVIVSTPIRPRI